MVNFNVINTNFRLKNKLKVRNWVRDIVASEERLGGEISYIFCDDEYLGSVNEKYLKHHTLTDIVTFDYSEHGRIAGDIFISVERVHENSAIFKTTLSEELARVMAHGILHLVGYKDKSKDDSKIMRSKEDLYLASFPNL
ncbi:MAG: rRNA maturation RNase YbeY [Bacteroidota bacterium]